MNIEHLSETKCYKMLFIFELISHIAEMQPFQFSFFHLPSRSFRFNTIRRLITIIWRVIKEVAMTVLWLVAE